MIASDFALLSAFLAFWVGIAYFCFHFFSCPQHLLQKDQKGRLSKTYYDYYGNYVSLFHALISLCLSTAVVVTEGINFGQENSFRVKLSIFNSMAYFIYDTIISEYKGYNTMPMKLHHFGAIISTFTVFYLGTCGNELSAVLFFGEMSNPFNLYREILKHKKQEHTKIYFQSSLIFVAIFIIARFGLIPVFIANYFPAKSNLLLKITLGVIWFISWHWLFIIFNFVLKELKKVVDKKDAKTSKGTLLDTAYNRLSALRKNKIFLASYYLVAGWISLGTLYMTHPRS